MGSRQDSIGVKLKCCVNDVICYTDYSLSLLSAHSRGQVTSVLPPPKKNTSYRRLFSLHCEQALVTKFRLKPQPRIMPSAAAHGTLTETPTGHSYWKCVHKNLFSLEGFNVVIKFSVKKKKKKRCDFTAESFDTSNTSNTSNFRQVEHAKNGFIQIQARFFCLLLSRVCLTS